MLAGGAAPGTVEARVVRFLVDEAAALNDERYDDWLGLLTDDFDYRMPAPCLHDDPASPRYDEDALLAWESASSLRLRFRRISSEFAWADRPPAMHRRHLTAVRLSGTTTDAEGRREHVVRSDVLVARSRRPDGTYLVSAGRDDVLREDGGGLRLARRRVYLDVEMPNVSQISIIF
jgi:3-phenylpropionate/cinnamic acid dioxygenase small subunit